MFSTKKKQLKKEKKQLLDSIINYKKQKNNFYICMFGQK